VYDPAPEPLLPSLPQESARILPIQRLGALIEVLICSGFPTQIFLITIMMAAGFDIRATGGALSPGFVFTLSLLDTGLVIALVFFFLHAHCERVRDVLLGNRAVLLEVLIGIALLPVVFGLAVMLLALIITFLPSLHNVPRNPLENMMQTRQDAMMFAAVVMIAGGLREEVQRGFILHRFDRYLGGGALGVLLYSVVFGLGHLEQGRDTAFAVALLGALWGLIYLTRRSIVAPMVSHAAFNLAQLLKYFLVR
jgi:membrane protease YdiL (CAAX protease family)